MRSWLIVDFFSFSWVESFLVVILGVNLIFRIVWMVDLFRLVLVMVLLRKLNLCINLWDVVWILLIRVEEVVDMLDFI